MLWFFNMGIIKPRGRFSGIGYGFFPHLEWRKFKDIVALWKNVIELLKYLFDSLRNFKRQHDIMLLLGKMNDTLVSKQGHISSNPYDLLRELISLRSKLRFI